MAAGAARHVEKSTGGGPTTVVTVVKERSKIRVGRLASTRQTNAKKDERASVCVRRRASYV